MRFTLAGLLVVPLVSLVALWGFAASITLSNALHEHNYNRLIALSSAPTDNLVNQVAQERLQTFTWLSTDPRPAEVPLAASRTRTDAAVSAYRRMLRQTGGLRPSSERPAQDTLVRLLAALPTIRASVDAETLSAATAFQRLQQHHGCRLRGLLGVGAGQQQPVGGQADGRQHGRRPGA